MRNLLFGLLLVLPVGCDTQTVCCETTDGFLSVLAGTCDGRVVADRRCANDVVDTGAISFSCETFCQRIVQACPQTTQCLETCQLAPFQPGPQATRCAENALDCTSAAICWDLITGSPV